MYVVDITPLCRTVDQLKHDNFVRLLPVSAATSGLAEGVGSSSGLVDFLPEAGDS